MTIESIIANNRTASNSASIFGTFYMSDSIKNTFPKCINAFRKSVLFRYGEVRETGKAEDTGKVIRRLRTSNK